MRFLTSIVLQDIEPNEGGPFGAIQKVAKSLIVPKKVGLSGDPSCVFEGLDVCFFFGFGRASEVGVVEV